jgi:hypothetical protein
LNSLLRSGFEQDSVLLRGEDEPGAAGGSRSGVVLEVAAGGRVGTVSSPSVVHLEDLRATVTEDELARQGCSTVPFEEADLGNRHAGRISSGCDVSTAG